MTALLCRTEDGREDGAAEGGFQGDIRRRRKTTGDLYREKVKHSNDYAAGKEIAKKYWPRRLLIAQSCLLAARRRAKVQAASSVAADVARAGPRVCPTSTLELSGLNPKHLLHFVLLPIEARTQPATMASRQPRSAPISFCVI